MFQPQPYSYPWGGVTPPPNYGQPQLNNLQQVAPQTPQPMPQQQPVQNGSFYGRVVGSIDEIKPSDIPTNGTIGLFPMSDYSCIFAKQWNNDGSISTVKFVPEIVDAEPIQAGSDISQIIVDKLDTIDESIGRLSKQLNYRNKKPYNKYDKDRNVKTEVSDNEPA